MEESNAKRRPKHLARMGRWRTNTTCYLRKRAGGRGHNLPSQFLQGAAYKLGSGAVTLIILWWEARR
ncbi:hypothetical protein LIX60_30880 [Streptomyces sp. S07_1.15]|uniref:hypothetical protein n=1 Tax=Streptomyces sp. S07_1.15 TaxID=2873925 RepID=UPI001D15DC02|nr:hypothetical protein [Streptomyces sp. S07_1.15]MCC3655788.1 hypothetical protein [Streptomyces sp. S07_1.15]